MISFKSTFSIRLFGDGEGPASKKERKDSGHSAPPQSPSAGWTKFKETNPDEYRTPLKDQRSGGGRRHQEGQQQQQQHPESRLRQRRQQQQQQRLLAMAHPQQQQQQRPHGPRGPGGPGGPRGDPRMNPFGGPGGPGGGPRPFLGGPMGPVGGPGGGGPMEGPFGNMFQNMNSTDPAIVESEVIPMIIHQARESFNSGNISHEQFADVMRHVMTLKEQTMMARADRRHHENKVHEIA